MSAFENNIISIFKDPGKQWLAELPTLVKSIAADWKLTELTPVANLSFNYVLSGYQHGTPVILKLGLDTPALAREALALKAYANFGGVAVLNEQEGVLLLEYVLPGESLKSYLPHDADQALAICCEVMSKLHQAPLPKTGLPHISDWLAAIDKPWDMPKAYLEKARKFKAKLLKNKSKYVLLHGDLHHDNILRNNVGWKVIDPKGVIGFPLNEVWAFIQDIEKEAPYIANKLGVDTEQVAQWYFVHLILSTCWNLEDGLSPQLFWDLAAKTYPLI
jgi:streptomycin 6-kinase